MADLEPGLAQVRVARAAVGAAAAVRDRRQHDVVDRGCSCVISPKPTFLDDAGAFVAQHRRRRIGQSSAHALPTPDRYGRSRWPIDAHRDLLRPRGAFGAHRR